MTGDQRCLNGDNLVLVGTGSTYSFFVSICRHSVISSILLLLSSPLPSQLLSYSPFSLSQTFTHIPLFPLHALFSFSLFLSLFSLSLGRSGTRVTKGYRPGRSAVYSLPPSSTSPSLASTPSSLNFHTPRSSTHAPNDSHSWLIFRVAFLFFPRCKCHTALIYVGKAGGDGRRWIKARGK